MAANPIRAAWDYLRGADLKAVPGPPNPPEQPRLSSTSQTSYAWLDQPGMQGVFSTNSVDTGADGNSAVFACLINLAYAHIEPPLKVLRQSSPEQDPQWLASSPFQELLDDPNPWHDSLEMHWWTDYARNADGNAYWRKIRAGNELTGNVIETWPISPRLIYPVTLDGSSNFIDYYEYCYAPGKKEKIPTENIVHFRFGVDDRDQRLGLAPIKRLVRLIASDEEATRFADALLQNYGVPGLVVGVPESAPITEDAALALKDRLSTAFGSSNRGNVGILTGGASMQQFGFSPQDLNLEVLHNVPEARIAAVMRIPPIMAGLGVGLDQTQNYASLRQIAENFTERTLVPTWRMDAAKINKQLKPDFTNQREVQVRHDLSQVRSLSEDIDALYRRLDVGVRSFWIRPSEARVAVGHVADPELDALWLARAAATSQPLPSGSVAAKALETKAADLEDLPAVFQAIVDRLEPSLERQLDGYFDGQRRRVNRALVSSR